MPWRSFQPTSSGPKPIEKAVTPTPHQRPTRNARTRGRRPRPSARTGTASRVARAASRSLRRSHCRIPSSSSRSVAAQAQRRWRFAAQRSDPREPSRFSVDGQRLLDVGGRPDRLPAIALADTSSTSCGDAGKPIRPAMKASTAISLAALRTVGIAPPCRKRRRAPAPGRESGPRPARSKVKRPIAARSRRGTRRVEAAVGAEAMGDRDPHVRQRRGRR